MSEIIISNVPFPYDAGCGILKLKHDECPIDELKDIWEDILPLNFSQIGMLTNLEQRRVGVSLLGMEEILADVKPKLLSKEVIEKDNTWIDENGVLKTFTFKDEYKLYEVEGSYFSKGLYRNMENVYFVQCKDTSTDREYMIWVDLRSVYRTNNPDSPHYYSGHSVIPNAIQCIAWTIQTDIPKGNIEFIIRQGDCIMIKPKDNLKLDEVRHLTEEEYRTLIISES